jgi:hypothetical protein
MKALLVIVISVFFSLPVLAYAGPAQSKWQAVAKVAVFPLTTRKAAPLQTISDEQLEECMFRLRGINNNGSTWAITYANIVNFYNDRREIVFVVYSRGATGKEPKAYSFKFTVYEQQLSEVDVPEDAKMFFSKNNNELQMKCD